MGQLEFASLVYAAFKAQGWTTATLEEGLCACACLDVWTKQVSEKCTTGRAERLVCRLVMERGLDPTKVRFGPVQRGHLSVSWHDRGAARSSLAARSTWKRSAK